MRLQALLLSQSRSHGTFDAESRYLSTPTLEHAIQGNARRYTRAPICNWPLLDSGTARPFFARCYGGRLERNGIESN